MCGLQPAFVRGAGCVEHVALLGVSFIAQDSGRMPLKRTLYTDTLTSLKCGIYHEDVQSKEPERFLFFVTEIG